jgi:toxin ParE1/3/4
VRDDEFRLTCAGASRQQLSRRRRHGERATGISSGRSLVSVKNPQAAAGFRSAFQAALPVLAEAPLRWAEVMPGVRRYLLPGYPCMLLYAIRGERVLVLSILHHARHPDTWRRGP